MNPLGPIESLLLGKALDLVLHGGKAAVARFVASTPTERLLWLLYEEHGDETGLGKDVFAAWQRDSALRLELERLVGGETETRAAPRILVPVIEPHLVRTPLSQRREVAESIAASAARAAPYVVRTISEATGAIVTRAERMGEGLLAAMSVRDRDGALTRALVQGPLELTGQAGAAAEAEALADADKPREAAALYLQVATALAEHELAIAAEAYQERAAMLLYAVGDRDQATSLLVEVGRARARRGSSFARSTAQALRKALGAESAMVGGLEALHAWPLDPGGASAALQAAVDGSSGEERTRWLAELVGLASMFQPPETVVAACEELDARLVPGARLELELDLLDAIELVDGAEAAEDRWAAVLDWVDTRATAADRGLVWQRRGVCLARRGETAASETAFRRSVAQWAQSHAGGEQVADALYSLQSAMALNGGYPGDPEERVLAAELRGPGESEAARAETLTHWGMRARIRGKLPDALRHYWQAYAIARRSGSLASRTEIAETLAELFAETGRGTLAIALAIDAGRGELAADLAKSVPGVDVAATLRPRGARWERNATWQVVAVAGRRLPEDVARDLVPIALAASRESATGFGPPALSARRAVAALAPFADGELRDEVHDQLTRELQGPPLDQRRAAAEALVLSTNAGITDATEALLRAYAADPFNTRGVHFGWLKERLEARPELAAIIRQGAIEGSEPLLALLVEAGISQDDADVRAACTRDAERLSKIETVREGGGVIQIGMGLSIQLGGITGRCAEPSARAALLARLLEMARDSRDSESNRAGAVATVDNLAPALDLPQAQEATDALTPLALGQYGASVVDENLDDPLSPTQIKLHTPQLLRAAAIAALAELAAAHPDLDRDVVAHAVAGGLGDGPEIVAAAALGALATLPELPSPIPVAHVLLAEDAQIRRAALVAWSLRENRLPDEPFLEALLHDPETGVRWHVLVEATKDAERGPAVLARIAEEDEDAYLRLVARRRIAEPPKSNAGDM